MPDDLIIKCHGETGYLRSTDAVAKRRNLQKERSWDTWVAYPCTLGDHWHVKKADK